MHGFCTDFARFQNVQRVLFAAKFDKECRNFKAKNHAISIEKCDKSKYPEIETNLRLALLISGPRVRVPGDSPDIERQIVRFGVLSLLRCAAQTRTCRGEAPPSCCARPFGRSNTPLGCLLLRKRELVGARPLHLLSQTVLSLKSPTGAFIAALRSANANF